MSKRWLVVMSAMAQLACSMCIARGSKVKTPRGERRIEELEVGDEVSVVDPVTLEEHVGKISAVKSAKRECALINSLRLTSAHPLFDTDKNEWAPAGDWVLGLRSNFATVDGPRKVETTERFIGIDDVFDLTIDHPLHTFVADGVVVHNKLPPFPESQVCITNRGEAVENGRACDCPLGNGTVVCTPSAGFCECGSAPVPSVSTVYRSQWFAFGDTERALLGTMGAARLRCGPAPRSLSVVGSELFGWFGNESVLALRGTEACFIDVDVPVAGSTWGHLWFFDRDFLTFAPGVVRMDDAVLLELDSARVWFRPSRDANGAPAPAWFLSHEQARWQGYEWQLEMLTPTTYRFWPRLRGSGGYVRDAAAFNADLPDGGSTSLEDWYDAGNAFAFANEADGGVRVVSLGQDARDDSGSRLHLANFALSNEGWIGE